MWLLSVIGTIASVIAISNAEDDKPEALVIPASEYFEGNDGPWSTFDLRIGDPEQNVRVLVSTASPQLMAVLPEGCSDAAFPDDKPSNCAVSRGKLFNSDDSDSWDEIGRYEINEDGVGLEANLGWSLTADWGLDEVGLGLRGPKLKEHPVATFAGTEPLYLGILGLNNQPVNFSSLGNSTKPSFLSRLKDDKKIPSLSWSYTAGARYRLKQVYGKLILSGYDTSRFNENSATFTLAEDLTRDIVVALQSISYTGSDSQTLLSDTIDIYIDSTEPNLWLPEEVCEKFEDAFGLDLDDDSGLYLVNDTHRNRLLDSDAEVSFRLSNDKGGGDTVSITLPYAAFDLKAKTPLVANESYYFPLKRAGNETQYTLGRVFLQEAYLSVDYERKTFNVSECKWDSSADENIVTILSKDDPESDSGDEDNGSEGSSESALSGGAIAGIVVGTIAAIAIVVLLILLFRRRNLKKSYAVTKLESTPDMTMIGGTAARHDQSSTSNMPWSSADVSGWTPSSNSPPRNGDSSASSTVPAAAANAKPSTGLAPGLHGSTASQRPTSELDGREISAVDGSGEQPQVFELAGSKVTPSRSRNSALGPVAEHGPPTEHVSRESPVSEEGSTLDSTGHRRSANSALVTPATGTFPYKRPF